MDEKEDIVARLRGFQVEINGYETRLGRRLLDEAADAIEARDREIERLREAMRGAAWELTTGCIQNTSEEIGDALNAALGQERGMMNAETEKRVTRFEVIDETGRAYVRGRGSVQIELSYQDDGRTLKVFVRSRPALKGMTPSDNASRE